MAEMEGKKGLFAPRPAPPPPELSGSAINELSARLRIAEQRSSELRKKLLFIEQNMVSNHKTALSGIKDVEDELRSVKHKLQDVEDNILKITKELRLVARKEDIDVM